MVSRPGQQDPQPGSEIPLPEIRRAFVGWLDERIALGRARGGERGQREQAAAFYARNYVLRDITESPALVADQMEFVSAIDAAMMLLERRFAYYLTDAGWYGEIPEGRIARSPVPVRRARRSF